MRCMLRIYDCEVDESFWITKEYFDLATEYFKEQQKGSDSEFSSESDLETNWKLMKCLEQKYIFISLSIKIEKTIENTCTEKKASTGNCKLKRQ